jgi:hypothetical protein
MFRLKCFDFGRGKRKFTIVILRLSVEHNGVAGFELGKKIRLGKIHCFRHRSLLVTKYDFGELFPVPGALGHDGFDGKLNSIFFFEVHITQVLEYLGSIFQFSREMSQKIKRGLDVVRFEFFYVCVRCMKEFFGEKHDFIV